MGETKIPAWTGGITGFTINGDAIPDTVEGVVVKPGDVLSSLLPFNTGVYPNEDGFMGTLVLTYRAGGYEYTVTDSDASIELTPAE